MFMTPDRDGRPAAASAAWSGLSGSATALAPEPARLVAVSECDVSPRLMSEYGSMLDCEVWCTDGYAGRVHRVLIDQELNAPYLALTIGKEAGIRLTLVPMEWVGGISSIDHRVYVNTQKQVVADAPAWDAESIPQDAVVVVDDYFERRADAFDALACLF